MSQFCRFVSFSLTAMLLAACVATTTNDTPRQADGGVLWVQFAAEYRALSEQAYGEAARDLPRLVEDDNWSALPGVAGDADKPPAIILDIDETVVSNYDFQIHHLPYTSLKHYLWSRDNRAVPVPGAVQFVRDAQAVGVAVFFVTNRACEAFDGEPGPCPQKTVTLQDLEEAGFDTDERHLMLADEQAGWGKEKASRRRHIAETHRVIMLFGDDLGDFVTCSRKRPEAPCQRAATHASRKSSIGAHRNYWGEGWYVLPNPMHGSWTGFL